MALLKHLVLRVYASGTVVPPDGGTGDPELVLRGLIVNSLQNFILPILGVIMFGSFVYAGFLFITSAGKTEQVTKARNTMIFSVLGFLLIYFAYSIVVYISKELIN